MAEEPSSTEPADDPELDMLEKVGQVLGAHYGDYLILVRLKDGDRAWQESNETWAYGAAERYVDTIRDVGIINRIKSEEGKSE